MSQEAKPYRSNVHLTFPPGHFGGAAGLQPDPAV